MIFSLKANNQLFLRHQWNVCEVRPLEVFVRPPEIRAVHSRQFISLALAVTVRSSHRMLREWRGNTSLHPLVVHEDSTVRLVLRAARVRRDCTSRVAILLNGCNNLREKG